MFKLLSVDNAETKGNEAIGKVDNFYYNGKNIEFANIRTSRVISILKSEKKLVVKTKNSQYIFEEQ